MNCNIHLRCQVKVVKTRQEDQPEEQASVHFHYAANRRCLENVNPRYQIVICELADGHWRL